MLQYIAAIILLRWYYCDDIIAMIFLRWYYCDGKTAMIKLRCYPCDGLTFPPLIISARGLPYTYDIEQFWTPPPSPLSRFLVPRLHKNFDTPPLRPWRLLWTTPKTRNLPIEKQFYRSSDRMILSTVVNRTCRYYTCAQFHSHFTSRFWEIFNFLFIKNLLTQAASR